MEKVEGGKKPDLLSLIRNLAFYGGTDKDSYQGIHEHIENTNRITALVFSSVAAVLISVMFCLSFFMEGFAASRPVYQFGVLFSVALIFVSYNSKKFPILSYVSVYMAVSVFLIYGILISTITRPDQQTVTFMVMLIFVPLIFVDRPVRMAGVLAGYIIVFIIMASLTKTGSILSVDVTDAIIFGLLSIVSETVINRVKIKGYVLENRLELMGETDQLTGLNNRNCYEMKLNEYPKLYKQNICCIYIDVNGLHELNNTKGHKAGDEMLQYIADVVIKLFGSDDTFRIGGDEYVAFTLDTSRPVVLSKMDEMNHLVTREGYHAAVGYAYEDNKNADIQKLIVKAESEMYRDKAQYYKEHDRRAR